MACPNCGKENPPGTRFCVHCGTAQPATPAAASPPLPSDDIMAGLGAAGGGSAARSDTAATLRSDPSGSETILIPRGATRPPPFVPAPEFDLPPPAADTVPPPPAYNAASSGRKGMFVVLGLALLGVLGIGGFFAYQLSRDHAREAEVASAGARDTTPPPVAEPAPLSSGPGTTGVDATPDAVRSDAPAEPARVDVPVPVDTAPAVPPVGAAPAGSPAQELPAVGNGRPARQPPRAQPPRTDAAPTPTVQPPAAPAQVAPRPTPVPTARPPAPAPVPTDRWAQMGDELKRCSREDFINRVVCDQRVRLRFCDGYWGRVAQCPGTANADHGQ